MLLFIKENMDLFLYLWFVNFCINIGVFFIAYKLYSQFCIRSVSLKVVIFIGLIFNIIQAFIFSVMTIYPIGNRGFFINNFTIIIVSILLSLIEVFLWKHIFNRLLIHFIFLLCVGIGAISLVVNLISESSPIYIFIIDNYTSYFIKGLARVVLTIVNIVFYYLLIFLCSKFRVFDKIRRIEKHKKVCYIFAFIIMFVLNGGVQFFGYAREAMGEDYNYILYILFIFLSVLVAFISMYSVIIRLKNKQMELSMKEQLDYTKRLEILQNELRSIHHDYKNVAAGLYLQAEKGNIDEIKDYVSNRLLQLDKNIQINIRQINQLVNINIIELKSLIFTKIEKALKENVVFEIEALNLVSKINMNKDDLLRCVGILLDNAIEESSLTDDKRVICSLLQDNDTLTVLIKNSLKGEVNISNIYKNGFSTKGEGRGIGLYSLKQIISTHKNIFLKTQVDKSWFTQILTIS